jgi:hypothetical protein
MSRFGQSLGAMLGLLLCATGCTKAQPAQADAAAAVASEAPAPQARMAAPLKLVVRGPTPPPQSGDFKLEVDVIANEPIELPLRVQVEMPPGAVLTEGAPQQLLSIGQQGTTTLQYTVRLETPLQRPILVTAETRDDAGVAGLRAQRAFPAAVQLSGPRQTGPAAPAVPSR